MKKALKGPVFWTAIAALTSLFAVGLQFNKSLSEPTENYVFLCDTKGTPLEAVVCIGPHGERRTPNPLGIVKIPQSWVEISVRDQKTFAEIALIQIPSPCPPTFKAIINTTR